MCLPPAGKAEGVLGGTHNHLRQGLLKREGKERCYIGINFFGGTAKLVLLKTYLAGLDSFPLISLLISTVARACNISLSSAEAQGEYQ
jgi:hypothetical protein